MRIDKKIWLTPVIINQTLYYDIKKGLIKYYRGDD